MPAFSRLAWLLRALVVSQVAAILAWLAWAWSGAPVQAVLGALLIALLGPMVLAVEFLLLAVVGRRDDSAPTPGAAQLLSAWAGESCQLFRVFYWRMPFRWRAPADHLEPACAGRRGAVFIHGFVCNRGFWRPWMVQLRNCGHPYVAVNLEPAFTSIDDYVPIVEAAVRRVAAVSGQPPVLVCHSMGGLVARAWLRSARAPDRVDRVITIASPHRGTWMGRFSRLPNGRQMRMDCDWLCQLERDEQGWLRPPWTCWYTNCDNIVFPVSRAALPGADNRCRTGVAHVALAFEPEVIRSCLAALSASGANCPRE